MNVSTLGLATAESEELTQLRNRVRALEIRLDRLERADALSMPSVQPSASPSTGTMHAAIDTEFAVATVFKRIAMLCFVLLGALILRVLTQQNILNAGFGTVLGFAYAGHLIVLSLMPGRFGGFAREGSLFQCSGAVLAFVIAIESAVGTLTMSRVAAMAAIAGFAFLALGMANHQRKVALAGTGVIGGILALVALDLKAATSAPQLILVVALGAAGIANSWREGWAWLRSVTILMMLLLLPAGFFFCGKEPGVAGTLLAAAAGTWCVLMLQHLVALRRLGKAAVWLPVATVWFAGIQYAAGWPRLGATTSGVAGLAFIATLLSARYAPTAIPALAGLIVSVALAGAIGSAMLDRTGLLSALVGIALWFAGRRVAPDWAGASATLLMLTSAGVGLAQLVHPPVAVSGLVAMSCSALVLVAHYVRNSRVGNEPYSGLAMRLAPVALVAGLALLLGLFWELLNRQLNQPEQLLLGQTVLVVVTALALTFWGHAAHRRSVLFSGLGCMALALVKVLLVDLMRLKSFYMLASLVSVGLASVAVSLILRRREARSLETSQAAAEPKKEMAQ